MSVKIKDKNAGKPKPVCQYCQSDDLTGKPVIICERCNAISHEQCIKENGACPTPGCARSMKVLKGGMCDAPRADVAPVPTSGGQRTAKQGLRQAWRALVDFGPQSITLNVWLVVLLLTTEIILLPFKHQDRLLWWICVISAVLFAVSFIRYWGLIQKQYYHKFPYDEP